MIWSWLSFILGILVGWGIVAIPIIYWLVKDGMILDHDNRNYTKEIEDDRTGRLCRK